MCLRRSGWLDWNTGPRGCKANRPTLGENPHERRYRGGLVRWRPVNQRGKTVVVVAAAILLLVVGGSAVAVLRSSQGGSRDHPITLRAAGAAFRSHGFLPTTTAPGSEAVPARYRNGVDGLEVAIATRADTAGCWVLQTAADAKAFAGWLRSHPPGPDPAGAYFRSFAPIRNAICTYQINGSGHTSRRATRHSRSRSTNCDAEPVSDTTGVRHRSGRLYKSPGPDALQAILICKGPAWASTPGCRGVTTMTA